MGKAGVTGMWFVKRMIGLVTVLALLCGLLASEAAARQRMSFRPGDRSRPAYHHHGYAGRGRHYGGRHVRRGGGAPASRAGRHRGGGEGEAAGKPGAGFRLENGILTYPAPERFQPRNLPHQ